MSIITPSEIVSFRLLLAAALVIALARIACLVRMIARGKPGEKEIFFFSRVKTTFLHVLAQQPNIESISFQDAAGLGHLFIFWGAIIFGLNYALFLFLGDGLGWAEGIRNSTFSYYLSVVSDIAAIGLLAAYAAAAWRRAVIRPPRLGPRFEGGLFFAITVSVFLLIGCYFVLEGLRIDLGMSPFQTPMGGMVAGIFQHAPLTMEARQALFKAVWWLQAALILGFILYAPYSSHQHPLFSPANIFLRSMKPIGAIAPVDFDRTKRLGATQIEDFSRKHLLQGFACTHCGRCQEICPAHQTGKPLSPKSILLDLRDHLLTTGKEGRTGNSLPIPEKITEGILTCTTCGACIKVCPVFNRPMDVLIELRRGSVYQGQFDKGHEAALIKTFELGNPNETPSQSRDTILGVLDMEKVIPGETYDFLYWLGCSAYVDERTQQIVRAVSGIAKKAGIKLAALGAAEQCCGDFVRRIGDEGLYQRLTTENIRTLKEIRFNALLTHCPHCFNTMKNEYPAFGGTFDVVHHSQFLIGLMEKGLIRVNKSISEILYHDPCYLGRYNSIYETPRKLLRASGGKVLEFPFSREKSFCCGAGGGAMWKMQESGTRINDKRLEQAIATGAASIATACPYCLAMMEDSILVKGADLRMEVKDIAEFVQDRMIE
ncbi:MAG: (Fe-S)-binding protein [Pseudomonadota bacterium]